MSLMAIKRYLKVQQRASLFEIKQALGLQDVEQLRQMLRVWINKGCVRCEQCQPRCAASCQGCPAASSHTVYVWQA